MFSYCFLHITYLNIAFYKDSQKLVCLQRQLKGPFEY